MQMPDFREGYNAFMEKRPPDSTARESSPPISGTGELTWPLRNRTKGNSACNENFLR